MSLAQLKRKCHSQYFKQSWKKCNFFLWLFFFSIFISFIFSIELSRAETSNTKKNNSEKLPLTNTNIESISDIFLDPHQDLPFDLCHITNDSNKKMIIQWPESAEKSDHIDEVPSNQNSLVFMKMWRLKKCLRDLSLLSELSDSSLSSNPSSSPVLYRSSSSPFYQIFNYWYWDPFSLKHSFNSLEIKKNNKPFLQKIYVGEPFTQNISMNRLKNIYDLTGKLVMGITIVTSSPTTDVKQSNFLEFKPFVGWIKSIQNGYLVLTKNQQLNGEEIPVSIRSISSIYFWNPISPHSPTKDQELISRIVGDIDLMGLQNIVNEITAFNMGETSRIAPPLHVFLNKIESIERKYLRNNNEIWKIRVLERRTPLSNQLTLKLSEQKNLDLKYLKGKIIILSQLITSKQNFLFPQVNLIAGEVIDIQSINTSQKTNNDPHYDHAFSIKMKTCQETSCSYQEISTNDHHRLFILLLEKSQPSSQMVTPIVTEDRTVQKINNSY